MKNKISENLKSHPQSDLLGMEEFIITEDFEALFSSLVGVYSRLASTEKFRKDTQPDLVKVSDYIKRSKEIYIIKKSILTKPLIALRDAIEEYRPELRKMENLEKRLQNG
ncbi:hypothetical protein [Pedobacter jeongneungensis]|uniref:hypothetical protein n=1 Tax=Pedobacter jeongneungensis TaxID=947309 RepID=UPI0004682C5C|nr:hypothetical protein [Pedobacter jeongneungensis]